MRREPAAPRADLGDALLRGLAASLRAMIRSPADRDLPLRQLATLLVLCTTPGPHTVSSLASCLHVARPPVTRGLDALEAVSLARRLSNPADRRSMLAEPTDLGCALVRRLVAACDAALSGREA